MRSAASLRFVILGMAVVVAALVWADAVPVLGQAAERGVKVVTAAPGVPVHNPFLPKPGPPPRHTDGHPDLNGTWDFSVSTTVQRPPTYGTTLFLPREEAAVYRQRMKDARNPDERDLKDIERDAYNLGMNAAWFDVGAPLAQNRSSLIVDPPDGQIPPLTSAAQSRMVRCKSGGCGPQGLAPGDSIGPDESVMKDERQTDHVTDRSVLERCLMIAQGPPFNPFAYNNNVRILHRNDVVVIETEMIHTARVVWLDSRPRPRASVGLWHGYSTGRWQDDTLIIETTNFRPDARWLGVLKPEEFTLVERLTRIDADTVLYEYTMNDAKTWTRPWTAQLPMKKLRGFMYEYACHEGNYSLKFQLSAERAMEKQKAREQGSPAAPGK